MYKLDLERAKEPDLITNISRIIEKARELKKKSASLITLKLRGSQKTGKLLKRWEYQTILLAFLEIYLQHKKQQLESDTEPWTSSKLGNEYIKVYIVTLLI